MLEWLGLSDAADFDPAHFDAQKVTQALSGLRRKYVSVSFRRPASCPGLGRRPRGR
jgi:hypothetical protein